MADRDDGRDYSDDLRQVLIQGRWRCWTPNTGQDGLDGVDDRLSLSLEIWLQDGRESSAPLS